MRLHLIVGCLLAAPVLLSSPARAQAPFSEDGLPPLRREGPTSDPGGPSGPGDAQDHMHQARELARRVGDQRLLSVRCFEISAADVAVLSAADPQAALLAADEEQRARAVGAGVKVELSGLTVVVHRFQSEADALAHAGAFLHHALLGAVGFPELDLVAGERPAQLVELRGKEALLAWGPALSDPVQAARALAAAREVFGLASAAQARAIVSTGHVQVTLLRPELPSLVALREALAARGQAESLSEERDGLRIRLRAHAQAGRLEITRGELTEEQRAALRELSLPHPAPAPSAPQAPPPGGLIEQLEPR